MKLENKVNVHAVFYCTREALRIMEPRKTGKIVGVRQGIQWM